MTDGDKTSRRAETANVEAVPAATLILLRDVGGGAPPQVLMLRRAGHMAFAAGALTFPGGRVDEDDHRIVSTMARDIDPEDAAGRVAAIRETLEETGLAVGFRDDPGPETVCTMRARMHAGERFGSLLAEYALALDLDALVPFARWCPPAREKLARRFDTRFYATIGQAGLPDGAVDGTENDVLRWDSADGVLAACAAGSAKAIFPTLRNLERLALAVTPAEVIALARRYPVELVSPWVEERGGVPHLCIPDHLGYPVTAVPLDSAFRS